MRGSGFRPAWRPPLRVSPAAAGPPRGGGLRSAWPARGGQRHRVLVPGDRGRDRSPSGDFARPDALMTDIRTVAVWGQVTARAAAQGRRVSAADICAVAVSSARLGGAWLVAARGG